VKLFHELLPGIVKDCDPGAAYWPSSPSYGRADPRSLTEGDSHYWGVWHDDEPFEAYTEKVPQFMSEFGFQSLPSPQTIMRFARPGDLAIDSPVMLAHQKNERGNEIIRSYMERYYRTPRDFESFVYVSQLLQAEGIRTGIEAHRRAKPYCMGSLFWQLDDCWPAASWSSIDYGGNPKALYYRARDAFSEVLVSPVIENGMVRVYVVSDRLSPVEGPVAIRLVDFTGNVIWESSHRVKIAPNASTCVFEDVAAHVLDGERSSEVVLCAEMFEGGALLSRNLLYFAPPKDLDLPRPDIRQPLPVPVPGRSSSTRNTERFLTLQTDVLAKNVYLSIPGYDVYFEDNYFDMLPGSTVTVRYITNEDAGDLDWKFRVMSLADTY
jgi:beta-mannosidase